MLNEVLNPHTVNLNFSLVCEKLSKKFFEGWKLALKICFSPLPFFFIYGFKISRFLDFRFVPHIFYFQFIQGSWVLKSSTNIGSLSLIHRLNFTAKLKEFFFPLLSCIVVVMCVKELTFTFFFIIRPKNSIKYIMRKKM